MYSKEWLQRAENLQLMTMDEQKLFLKVLENRLFFNCRYFSAKRILTYHLIRIFI